MTAILDQCRSISIPELRRRGYFMPYCQTKSGTMAWTVNGNRIGSISITLNTFAESPYLELNYTCNGAPIRDIVQLVLLHSNLGKGKVWYFICPQTGKRCRKLYAVGERFLHREASKGCMYLTQAKSHKQRELKRLYDLAFGADRNFKPIKDKHFKDDYAGKPTKRFLRRMEELEQSRMATRQLERDLID